jgi:hypothetical protein
VIFHAHVRDLDFELGGRRYIVPRGSEVEIPDRIAYCIRARGLALAEGPNGGERVKATAASRPRPVAARATAVDGADLIDEVAGDDVDDDAADADDDPTGAVTASLDSLARNGVAVQGRRGRRGRE